MPQVCTVCASPERNRIDALLLTPGASVRAVARATGLSEPSLRRHKANHADGTVLAVLHKRLDTLNAEGIVGEFLAHYDRTVALLNDGAADEWDPKDRIALHKEIRQSIEGMARIGLGLAANQRAEEVHASSHVSLDDALSAALDRAEARARERGVDVPGRARELRKDELAEMGGAVIDVGSVDRGEGTEG